MHDLRMIRENPQAFDAALARRGLEPVAATILSLDEDRRALTTQLQEAQSRRNEASKAIGQAMGKGDKDTAEALKAEVAEIKTTMPALEERERAMGEELTGLLATIPNLPAEDVPEGADEDSNVEVSRWGALREFDFTPVEHADLAPALGMDFETGTKLSGARFTFLRGDMARLHRAIAQFMLDVQTRDNGYTECNPPVIVNSSPMFGTGQLPKFEEDLYPIFNEFKRLETTLAGTRGLSNQLSIANKVIGEEVGKLGQWMRQQKSLGRDMSGLAPIFETFRVFFAENVTAFQSYVDEFNDLRDRFLQLSADNSGHAQYLIPTAEVSLTNTFAGDILPDLSQPIRLTAHTLCFRSEAGSAGKDTRGFIRQHQFEKVELVSICAPDQSDAEHERMTGCAEGILKALDLPYRKVLLCTGDMGFGARKTYDLEVWLPGQGAYREISSCSNTGDFQARRMNTRFRPEAGEKKTEFAHTLNGSGLAVGRTLVAVLENYQQEDGSVLVPDALNPYMGGVTKLTPA